MSYATISSAIAAIVDTSTNVANVYAVPEWAVDPNIISSKFANTLSSTAVLQAWWIWRSLVEEVYGPNQAYQIPDHQSALMSTYIVTGYLRHSEANGSEAQFQLMVDDIMTSLRGKITLSGSVEVVVSSRVEFTPTVITFFGGIASHRVDITLVVRERMTGVSYS